MLVIGGLYAWGRRESLSHWWQGQRDAGHDDSAYGGSDEDEDFAAELKRLRNLMDADAPSTSRHDDLSVDPQRDGDPMIEVQISAPRSVPNPDTGSVPEVNASSRDVLFEGYESVSAPHPSSGPGAEKTSVEYADSDDMIDIEATPRRPSVTRSSPVNAPASRAERAADPLTGSADGNTKTLAQEPKPEPKPKLGMDASPALNSTSEVKADRVADPVADLSDGPGSEFVSAPRVVGKNPEAGKRKPLPTKEPHFKPVEAPARRMPVQESLDLPEPEAVVMQTEEPGFAAKTVKPAKPTPQTAQSAPRRKLDQIIDDDPGLTGPAPGSREDRAGMEAQDPEGATPGLTDLGVKVAGNVSETVTGWGESVMSFCRKHAPKKREETVVDTPEEILVVNVLARNGGSFNGALLRQALEATGLTQGRSGLYEVLPKNRATTTAVLCVANMIEPGVLTDDVLTEDMHTPGLTLFLKLPGPVEGVDALEQLLVTAQHLARELDGEMRDQHRNVLTKQNMALMYEQVVEHARRMRLALSRRR